MAKQEKNTSKKGIILIIIAVVLIVAIALTGYFLSVPKDPNRNLGSGGDKTITVEIMVDSKDVRLITINTSAETLLGALQEHDLIDGEQQDYGYFITAIDDVVVDPELSQWWCIRIGDLMIDTSVDKTPIKDGDKFILELIDALVTSSDPTQE